MPPGPFSFAAQDPFSGYLAMYPGLAGSWAAMGLGNPTKVRGTPEGLARQRGLDLNALMVDIAMAADHSLSLDPGDWTNRTITELVDNILTTHHRYTRAELGRAACLCESLVTGSQWATPRLADLQATITNLRNQVTSHLEMEEQGLFPYCLEMDKVTVGGRRPVSEDMMVRGMRRISHDHRDLDGLSDRIERTVAAVSGDIPDALHARWRVFSRCITNIQRDLSVHSFKEDEVLIPAVGFLLELRSSESEVERARL